MATKTAANGTKARGGRSTREAILEAASRLIHVHGYNHTSLDDVLRESGVGKGNFYYHFKSKEELGYAILDQAIASFLAETLEPCFSDPGRPRRSGVFSTGCTRSSASRTVWGGARSAISRRSSRTFTKGSARAWPS